MVIAGGKFYIVDIGPESSEVLAAWRVPMNRVGGVFITHFHSDHIADLGEFNMNSWVLGREKPLDVYGPPGVERLVAGFSEAYALDQTYRTAHHGAELMNPEIWKMVARPVVMPGEDPTGAQNRTQVAFQDGELKVTAFEVHHNPIEPAYGYRFDYKGRSIVISGDTIKHLPLVQVAKDVDVIFHEAQAQHMVKRIEEITRDKSMPRLSKLMFDIQVLAFQSDMTRVFSFKTGRDASSRTFPESGTNKGFHPASHHGGRESAILEFNQINRYHMSMLPYFLQKLEETKEGDGTMLDNTTIMYGSPMADGNIHNHRRCPLLLMGGDANLVPGGTHLRAPDGTPMADVMLSLLHKYNIDVPSFGDSLSPFALYV
jgi:hypothetical protein